MKFTEVCCFVNDKLKQMSLKDRVILFDEFFKSPISYKDGTFFYNGIESNETRISDYLSIRQHWMSVGEFDKLYTHFKKEDSLTK